MIQIIAATIAAAGAVLAAIFGSRFLTREGRLLFRLQRMGDAYSLLPESDERRELEGRVLEAAAELNDWIDPGKVARRWLLRIFTFILFIAAVALLSLASDAYGLGVAGRTFWGIAAGLAVGSISLLVGALLQRFVDTRKNHTATAARLERISKGEPPMASKSS